MSARGRALVALALVAAAAARGAVRPRETIELAFEQPRARTSGPLLTQGRDEAGLGGSGDGVAGEKDQTMGTVFHNTQKPGARIQESGEKSERESDATAGLLQLEY